MVPSQTLLHTIIKLFTRNDQLYNDNTQRSKSLYPTLGTNNY